MRSLRMMMVGASLLIAAQAFADIESPPPPDFGDCVAAKQKKSPADDCQECNGLYEDICEKQWKSKGYTQSCKVKPENAGEWREVWCKSPTAAEPAKEPAASAQTAETKKEGGCAVGQEGSASWLWVLGLGFLVRRRSRA